MSPPLEFLAVVSLAGLLFAGALLAGQAVARRRRWTRPVRFRSEPIPRSWPALLHDRFPLSRELAPEDRERLLRLMQLFLHEKRIEGAGGLEITEEIRVTVAAQACFLLLWLEVGVYPALETVVIYPSTMLPGRPGRVGDGGLHTDAPSPVLGESWSHGVVVLSWDSSRQGAVDPGTAGTWSSTSSPISWIRRPGRRTGSRWDSVSRR